MRVSVAPARNIPCNCCNRECDCGNASRPGAVSQKLTPDQAVKKAVAVASEIPQMAAFCIAGPGDSLAKPKETCDTFRILQEQEPAIQLRPSIDVVAWELRRVPASAQSGCVGSIQGTFSGGSAGSMSRLIATASPSLRTSTHSSVSVGLALISWCGT